MRGEIPKAVKREKRGQNDLVDGAAAEIAAGLGEKIGDQQRHVYEDE